MNNKLDDFFKDKLEGDIPEFQEKYWEQAERLLEKDKRRRKPLLWWFFGVALLLLGVVFSWLMLSQNKNEIVENSQLETQEMTIINDLEVVDNQRVVADDESDAEIILDNNIENKEGAVSTNTIRNAPTSVNENRSLNITKKARTNSSEKITNTPAEIVSELDRNTSKKEADKSENKPIAFEGKSGENTPIDATISNPIFNKKTNTNTSEKASTTVNKLPLNLVDLEGELTFPFEVNKEMYKKQNDTPNTTEKVDMGIFAAVGLFPFQEELAEYPSDIHGGLFMDYAISKKWIIEGRFGGHMHRALEEEVAVTRNLRYSFGLTETEKKYIKQKEYFAEMGLMLGYRLSKKQQLSLGAGADFLLFQYGEIRTNTSNFPWEMANEETLEKSRIKLEDTARFYPYLTAQYNYQFTKNWGVYLRAKHFPFKKEMETFNNKFRVNLGLKYTL